ncbi:MAG: polysaccharide deacetylase family protein [Syntrophorhabdales bacterium]|jgi:hypothetical protein
MRLIISLDSRLPDGKLARAAYTWELIARSLGISAEVTDQENGGRRNGDHVFRIRHGIGDPSPRRDWDLFVPYEEIDGSIRVKYPSGPPLADGGRCEPGSLLEDGRAGFDVASLIFHLVSGMEELVSGRVDDLGRHITAGTFFHEHALYGRPLVDMYIGLIGEAIRRTLPAAGFERPRGFAVALSHDVDSLTRFSLTNASNNLLSAVHARGARTRTRSGLAAALSLAAAPLKYLARPAETAFFDRLCSCEERYGARSTFLLLPPRRRPTNPLDSPYSYREMMRYGNRWHSFAKIVGELQRAGWEMGLHAGVDSYRDEDVLMTQKRSVEEVTKRDIRSVRQHRLRFHIPDTWEAQERAGIANDSTCGFNLGLGFRALIAHPYRPFSLKHNRPLGILELPLVIQDKGILRLGWSHEERVRESVKVLDEVKKWGGAAAILWHSDSVNDRRYPALLQTYEEIIDWAISQGAFVGSMSEVEDWWRRRQQQVEVTCRTRLAGP